MNEPTKSPNGTFKKGSSGNPAGRPAGSRNKSTLACEELLEGQAQKLTQKAVELALEGNIPVLRLCLERVIPVRKERCITLELQPIESAKDLPVQFQDIMLAIAKGKLTPSEGESMSNILTSHARLMEVVQLDQRVAELEASTQEAQAYRSELKRYLEQNALEVYREIPNAESSLENEKEEK